MVYAWDLGGRLQDCEVVCHGGDHRHVTCEQLVNTLPLWHPTSGIFLLHLASKFTELLLQSTGGSLPVDESLRFCPDQRLHLHLQGQGVT